jgi:hypothetical protein
MYSLGLQSDTSRNTPLEKGTTDLKPSGRDQKKLMITKPQNDLRHVCHVGADGQSFGLMNVRLSYMVLALQWTVYFLCTGRQKDAGKLSAASCFFPEFCYKIPKSAERFSD